MEKQHEQAFRGSCTATVDDKGRLKLPVRLKSLFEERYGREVFVTSLDPSVIQIYPLPVYEELERRVLALSPFNQAVRKWIERANYGQQDSLDAQGRVTLPSLLRDVYNIAGEVVVSWRGDHAAVVLRSHAQDTLSKSFTQEDFATLSAVFEK